MNIKRSLQDIVLSIGLIGIIGGCVNVTKITNYPGELLRCKINSSLYGGPVSVDAFSPSGEHILSMEDKDDDGYLDSGWYLNDNIPRNINELCWQ
jgi:hypothetical protein